MRWQTAKQFIELRNQAHLLTGIVGELHPPCRYRGEIQDEPNVVIAGERVNRQSKIGCTVATR